MEKLAISSQCPIVMHGLTEKYAKMTTVQSYF